MLRIHSMDFKSVFFDLACFKCNILVNVIKSCVYLCFLVIISCGDDISLFSGLSESDANDVLAKLADHGIRAEKKDVSNEGIAIFVKQLDISVAVRVLDEAGLPRKNRQSLGDVFQKEGLISSPVEERARYIYALSQELEHTFSQIQGVIIARVHVVLPEKVAPGEPMQLPSAGVFIKHTADLDPDVVQPKIRRMVESSIPGLSSNSNVPGLINKKDNVAVVFMPSKTHKLNVYPSAALYGHSSELLQFTSEEKVFIISAGFLIAIIASILVYFRIEIWLFLTNLYSNLFKRLNKKDTDNDFV